MIDNGSATANELRRFLDDNKVDLAELINELVTTGEVVVRHLAGVEQMLVLYPYVVEGGFTVVARSPGHRPLRRPLRDDPHDQPRGLPRAATSRTDRRPPQDGENRPMNMKRALCRAADPVQRPRRPERPAAGRRTALRSWRRTTGSEQLHWGTRVPRDLSSPGSLAPRTLGGDSWKWLFLQPLMSSRE